MSIPDSWASRITQQILWQRNFASTSFFIALSVFDEFEYWITGLLNRARRKAGIKPKGKNKDEDE
jgi:hypothetical protein